MNPLDQIILKGLRASAFHGVLAEERRVGQVFLIDVTVSLDLSTAGETDDLAQTIHYGELAEQIVAAVESDPVDLIETVAERVAQVVLAHPQAFLAEVTVHKPSAPISVPFEDVAVRIMRGRPERLPSIGFSQ